MEDGYEYYDKLDIKATYCMVATKLEVNYGRRNS